MVVAGSSIYVMCGWTWHHEDVLYLGDTFVYSTHDEIWTPIHATGDERWGAGVETQKNVRGEIGGWGRVPFNETYAPSLSTIYDGA